MPHVLRWLIGLTTSLVGSQIFLVALSWVAVRSTTPANVGWILMAGAIPQAVLLVVGGAFVDRIGPKRIIIISDSLRTVVMVVFALVAFGSPTKPILLGGLAVLFGVVDGFFQPAISAAPRYLGPRASGTRIIAAKTVVYRASEFLGAPLGTWLLLIASAALAFWVNAALFALSVAVLALTRMSPPAPAPSTEGGPPAASVSPRKSVLADLRATGRLILRRRALAVSFLVVFIAELGFGGPMMAGVPLLANETGWGVRTIGWVLGGFGLGAAGAAGFLTWRKAVGRTGVVMAAGLAAMGIAVFGLGVLPRFDWSVDTSLVVAGLLGIGAGVGSGLYGTVVTAAVLQMAPDDQVGRVMGSLLFFSRAAIPFTFAITGLLASAFSARLPFVLGGALVLIVGVLAFVQPELRRTTEPAQQEDALPVASG